MNDPGEIEEGQAETERPLVFMAMPHYGGLVNADCAKAFWTHAVDESIDILNTDHGSSLLANTFNSLWCAALNMRANMPADCGGRKITHFAMLHSDVAPAAIDADGKPLYWLKTLIEELDRTDADLCSAVVPIKSGDGITSTAISSDNPFRVERRLTIKEVQKLPETFDAEACGFPGRTILANTGCWVCRFDRPWVEKVFFEIRDRIDVEGGKFVPKVLPEDWNFSRQIFDLGGKIVCTRKVPIRHHGGAAYTMERATGKELDHMAQGWPLPPFVQPEPEREFPYDVDGWLTPAEGEALRKLATGKDVLEIGSYCGRSTICLSRTAKSVLAIDPLDGRATPKPRDTSGEFHANLKRYAAENVAWKPELNGTAKRFQLAFIDGDHTIEGVRADITKVTPLLDKGGAIAFHDYDSNSDPQVVQAVDEYLAAGAKIVGRYDRIIVVEPPSRCDQLAIVD